MSGGHTPGPWEAAYGADGYYAVYSNGDQELSKNTQANCDLIAAAPELLDALEAINAMPYYAGVVPPEQVDGLVRRYHKALDLARAAIAKATGK